MTSALHITHRPEVGRFEVHVDGLQCEADYRLEGKLMHMTHTGVPHALEGRGIAAALVKEALTWAQAQGYRVDPICSYVQVYIRRHPEWSSLLV